MESSIFGFTLRHSWRQQLVLLAIIVTSYPFIYLSLDLPKQIVDQAIAGSGGFPKTIDLGFARWELDQIPFLMVLSFLFLSLVILNGAFKYYTNTYKGRLNERMLRRLRYELYVRVLRFPLPQFRKMSSGEIIPMITSETDPIGNFIGESLATPAQQGGMLVVYLTFIFMQDPILGVAAISLYPLQGWLIPRLQRKVNNLSKQRVRMMRIVSDRIGDTVAGIQEVRVNDAAAWHLADMSRHLGEIYHVRYEIYHWKQFIKFLNNFINQLTPFFFYAIGGYLVITGSISFGALVAVLAAYKDLAGPWKELLDWYQLKEDVRVKYDQVVEQFHPEGMRDPAGLLQDPRDDTPFTGDLAANALSFASDMGSKILDGVSFSIPVDGHTAIVGVGSGSGADELALLIAGLLTPSQGRLRIGDRDLPGLPESVIGRRIAYVGANAYLMNATLRENLLYGLRHRPLRPPAVDPARRAVLAERAAESRRAGNVDFDIDADWTDYAAAGVDGPAALDARVHELLRMVELTADVYGLGLLGTLDQTRDPAAAEKVLAARAAIQAELSDPLLGTLVERFDPDRYNNRATVAENLMFGTPVGGEFAADRAATHPYVRDVLDRTGLTGDFLRIGLKLGQTMVELFKDLSASPDLVEQFSFINAEDLPAVQAVVQKVGRDGVAALKGDDRARLLQLPFRLVAARHRLGLIDEPMKRRILEARHLFSSAFPAELRGTIEFFDVARYNSAASIQDNILFGKVALGLPQVGARIHGMLAAVVERTNLWDVIVGVGLDMPVGIGGSRLSLAQRQKIVIARALLKNADLLIVNEATAALDGASQAVVHTMVLEARRGRGLVWVIHRPDLARQFDRILVMQGGHLVEQGTFEELSRPGSIFADVLDPE
jgi:ABC-type multidrug transport system fused ATPase/permease subunit